MSFGAGAVRLAPVAALMLGWRPQDFWAATPAELGAILRLWMEKGESGAPGMDTGALAMLKEQYPDE